MANRINFDVGFTVDKSTLTEVKTLLSNISTSANKGGSFELTKELKEAGEAASKLEKILDQSWNGKLSQLDLSKVNKSITDTFGSVSNLRKQLEQSGQAGTEAYTRFASSVLNSNLQLKQGSKILDDFAITFKNTIRFGISSSIFNNLSNGIQKAYDYSKRLDTSLNEIRIVSGKSADDMERFAVQANKAAKNLGASTLDYTKASTIYYQQGLNDKETAARTDVTLKAANVTNQSGDDVSEQLTAIWNGYKVSADEAELYIDKVAKVAATTAADLEEMATGMSKVASAANSAGVDIDQLNASLATVISVTREAPETVGTAFKTIYARLGDLKLNGTDEYGVSLGKVSSQMKELGVDILDQKGEMRDMGDVIEETAGKWKNWTNAQRQAAAVAMAGKMQYSRLIALFDNWDMYENALKDSKTAAGELNKEQSIYMESTEAHLKKLRTEAERTYDILFNTDTVNFFTDAMTNLLGVFNNWMDGVGGGLSSIIVLATNLSNILSKQIASGISGKLQENQKQKDNQDRETLKRNIINDYQSQGKGDVESTYSAGIEKEVEWAQTLLSIKGQISSEEYNALTALQQEAGVTAQKMSDAENWNKYLTEEEKHQNVSLNLLKRQRNELKKMNEGYQTTMDDLEEVNVYLNQYLEALDDGNDELADINLNKMFDGNTLEKVFSTVGLDNSDLEDWIDKVVSGSSDAVGEAVDQFSNIWDQYQAKIDSSFQHEDNLNNAIKQRTIYESEEYKQLENQARSQDEILKRQDEIAKKEQVIQLGIQSVSSAIGLITTGVGIISTLGDDDLTGWEKLANVVTTLGMSLPMLITGFNSVKSLMPALAVQIGAVSSGAQIGFAKATIEVLKFQTALGPIGWVLLGITAAVAAVGAAVAIGIKEWNKDADAAEKAAKASEKAAEAADSAKTAYENLSSSMKDYEDAVKKLEELTEGTKEYETALGDANQKVIDLVKSNAELAKYVIRDNKGLLSFNINTDEIIEEARKRSQKAQAAENVAQITANEKQLASERTNVRRSIKLDTDSQFGEDNKNGTIITKLTNERLEDITDAINENKGILNENTLSSIKWIKGNEALIKTLLETNNKKELENLASKTKELADSNKVLLGQSLRSSLEGNKGYSKLSNIEKEAVANSYEKGLDKDAKQKVEDKVGKSIKSENLSSLAQEYAESRGWTYTTTKGTLNKKGVFKDESNETQEVNAQDIKDYVQAQRVADRLAQYDPSKLQEIQDGIKKINEAGKDLGGNNNFLAQILGVASGEKLDKDELSYGIVTQLEELLSSGELQDKLKNVTEEEWKALGFKDAEAYINSLRDGLGKTEEERNKTKENAKKVSNKKLGAVSDNAISIQEKLQSGKINSSEDMQEDEDYTQLKEQLDELKDTYPEVTAAAQVLDKTWLVGTQEYAEALEQVQDKLYQAKIASLTDDANDKIKDLQDWLNDQPLDEKLELDDDEFQKKLNDVLNAEYKIDVAIHAEAEDEFNDIVSSMDDINEKASMIGENFVVSANDVRELNNTFPGIIQNMKDLGDGTVQLNKDAAQSAISMAQTEVAADSQATITKLKNQASLLRQKQASYQAMANAALILAKGEANSEKTSADARATISSELAELKSTNDKIQSQTEMDNDKAAADASNENAQITAKNWNLAYQSAAQSSYQFAQTAINNMKAAAGKGSAQKPGDFGVNWKGSSGKSSEAKTIESTQKALNSKNTTSDEWAKLAQQYQMLANSAGKSANDIDGMIAQIGASNVEIGSNFGSIKSGKGPKSNNSSSSKDPDKMDNLEDEKDRYHDINIILKQIDTEMSRLEKQKEKLFGGKLIDNLNKQLKVLDKQISATNQKIGIARQEVSELQGKLAGKGVSFNADGTIANYASAYQAQLGYVNNLINQYNSMSAEAQEKYKDTVEKAKKDFETFKSNIEKYDTLISDTIPGLEDDIQEAIDKKIDIQIEEFDMEIEIRLNLTEAERDWNEFKRKVIDGIKDDDILGNTMAKLADFSSYYKEDETGIVQALQRQVDDTLAQLRQMDNKGWSDVYGDNRSKALEDLKNYYDQLVSNLEDIEDLQKEIHDSYIDMMDEAQDKFDDQINTYETLSDLIQHDMKVIQLLNGDEAYSQLGKYYEKQEQNYNKQLDFQRQQVNFWKQQMDTLQEGSDEWEKAKENWMDAVSDWNSAVESAIENLQDKYANAINEIFQNLNNKVTNNMGLDYVGEQWQLINDNADQYLDTVNSLYETQKLESKYLDAIEKTDSLGARRKLKKLMDEELEDLRERDKLTEYDIERANKKYEIALKQIALEEAQQNKSQMRLRRDSQGNYSYQFVADDDEVQKAQDELNDLYNSLYNFDKDRYQNNLDQLYSIWSDFQEKMAEAAKINDPVAREEKELLLKQQYGELINGLVEQNEQIRKNLTESAFDDLAKLYKVDVDNFQNMSDEEKDTLMSDLIPYWTSGAQQMADVFAGEDGFLGVCKKAFEEITEATKDYENSLDELEDTAGTDFDNITSGVDTIIDETDDLLQKNDELINSYQEELDAIASVIAQLDSLIAKYTAAKNEAIAATTAAYNYWVQEQRNAAAKAAQNSHGGSGIGNSGSGANGSGSGSGRSGGGGRGDGNLTTGDTATYTGRYYYDSFGTSPAGSKYSGVANGIVVDRITGNPYGIHIHSADGKFRDLGWVKRSQLSGYDTGGYTGNWGDNDGKLALLHKKELVLNAQDTKNMLNAMAIVRQVTNSIGSSVLAKLSSLSANNLSNDVFDGNQLEQNVHIDATFPNVTNSHEVEDAINNLVNMATQRIHR